MDKFSIDYEQLNSGVSTRKVFRLADVKDRVEKIAFDVVRFVDPDDADGLWKIEKRDDEEVIVAMYGDDEPIEVTAGTKSPWYAVADKTKSYINIFYKGEPVRKLALTAFGFSEDDAHMLARNLPKALATNANLVRNMINELSDEDKSLLLQKYPELNV